MQPTTDGYMTLRHFSNIAAGSFAAVVTWNFAAVMGGLMFVRATFSPKSSAALQKNHAPSSITWDSVSASG